MDLHFATSLPSTTHRSMPFSHHSHSGQFCGHAVDTLEDVVLTAISKKMTTFCMTEHMPRNAVDFYPEEAGVHTEESLAQLYDDFYQEARRLQAKYVELIQLFVGFECDWIRNTSKDLIQNLLDKYPIDLFVGSVHHVHTVPIDYDYELYSKARDIAGGTDERVFEDYFDSQFEMLQALQPPVVGHFDLIRLKSDDAERSFRTWPSVWAKIERNLRFIVHYGGIVELNSSSLRKGMSEAYPQIEICKAFRELGGSFTLSDDSHGSSQVGLNFERILRTIAEAGIPKLCCLVPASSDEDAHDSRFPSVTWQHIPISAIKEHTFFRGS